MAYSNSDVYLSPFSGSEARLLGNVDVFLLETLLRKSKELGPQVLNDSTYDSLLTPFDLTWIIGTNTGIPIINLTSEDCKEIFYTAVNIGIFYDYCERKMYLLKGHKNRIFSASSDHKGTYLVTADKGPDNLILFWDIHTRSLLWSIFNHPPPPSELLHVSLSENAKLLITIVKNHHKISIEFWFWTEGQTEPEHTYVCPDHPGLPKCITFHPNYEEHFMVVFEKKIYYFEWDTRIEKIYDPLIPEISSVFHYTGGTYVDQCHECFISTTSGSIAVFGNTLYAKPFNKDDIDNKKMLIKTVKITSESVTCIKSVDGVVVTGDAIGNIMFFDKRLKLLYWFSRFINQPIFNIAFKPDPQKFIIIGAHTDQLLEEDSGSEELYECQDRTEEYEVLTRNKIPRDASLERNSFYIPNFFISTTEGGIYLVNFKKKKFIPLFGQSGSNVAALDVHCRFPHLLIAYEDRHLCIYNYLKNEEVISGSIPMLISVNDDGDKIETAVCLSTIKYCPRALHLACGTVQGYLWMLNPATLEEMYVAPMKLSNSKIMKIIFSPDSLQMACYDSNMTVFAFTFDLVMEEWILKGKIRSHYKDIVNIVFTEEKPYILYSLGKDRNLIKYADLMTELFEIHARDRIEQIDVPNYFISYVKEEFSKSGYFLVADTRHKFKLISDVTRMCSAVFLGPAYGSFQESPVRKIEFIPGDNKDYLIFMNNKYIGIELTPIDGNPYKFVGIMAHPEQLEDFVISADGQFVFTIAKHDRSIFMWRIIYSAPETMYELGGTELQPFYCLIEGGKNGFQFQEIRDLFYYMQILQQGVKVTLPRVITNSIHLAELPDLVRACGYYPSEFEIENLLTNAKFRDFDLTGIIRDKVTFCDFVKLFINHKPAYGYPLEPLEKAFNIVTTYDAHSSHGTIDRDEFIDAITTTGESVNKDHIYKCLATLMRYSEPTENSWLRGEDRDFSFLPSTITFPIFADEMLGINLEELDLSGNTPIYEEENE